MQFPVLFPRIGMPLRWKSKSKQKSCPDRTALFMCYEKKLISKKREDLAPCGARIMKKKKFIS